MRLRASQVHHALQKGLAPVFLVSGDEPLQLAESADAIRTHFRNRGFTIRELYDVTTGFDWNGFLRSAESLSLFSEKRILELRLLTAKPGSKESKALIGLSENPPNDVIVLITAPKISASIQKTNWFQSIEKHGVVIQVWPLEGPQVLNWLKKRLLKKGIKTDPEGLRLLASRFEGNLLAAAQEIDKIFANHGPGTLGCELIEKLVSDNSRFDVFRLMDAVLQGTISRASKILFNLLDEGIAPPVILWGLMKETRLLIQMRFRYDQGEPMGKIVTDFRVWENRKPLVLNALKRLTSDDLTRILRQGAQSDRVIKGVEPGDPRDHLLKICTGLCGFKAVTI